jgi:hypothetical protein
MSKLHLTGIDKNEAGQITAYAVGLSLILFGIMALALDIGLLHLQRRVTQNAADPGALAGAAYLGDCPLAGQGTPATVGEQYANHNLGVGKGFSVLSDAVDSRVIVDGFTLTDALGTQSYDTVYVRVDRDQAYLLGKIFGLTSAIVPAEAEAACVPGSGGAVCPFAVEINGTDIVYDSSSGDLVSAFGIEVGKVYTIKATAHDSENGNFNLLQLVPGGPREAYRDFVGSGCRADGSSVIIQDDDILTDTMPGNKNGHTGPAFESLYAPELSNPGLFPNGHRTCNLPFVIDEDGADNVAGNEDDGLSGDLLDSNGNPMFGQDAIDFIDNLSNTTACNGKNGDVPVPGLIHPAVSGRFIQIVLIDDLPNGASDPAEALGVLQMYVVCWDQFNPGNGSCATGVPNGQQGVYGVFGKFSSKDLLRVQGASNNPFAPEHSILIK